MRGREYGPWWVGSFPLCVMQGLSQVKVSGGGNSRCKCPKAAARRAGEGTGSSAGRGCSSGLWAHDQKFGCFLKDITVKAGGCCVRKHCHVLIPV